MTEKEKIELRKFCVDKALQMDPSYSSLSSYEMRRVRTAPNVISDAKEIEKYILAKGKK